MNAFYSNDFLIYIIPLCNSRFQDFETNFKTMQTSKIYKFLIEGFNYKVHRVFNCNHWDLPNRNTSLTECPISHIFEPSKTNGDISWIPIFTWKKKKTLSTSEEIFSTLSPQPAEKSRRWHSQDICSLT